MLDLLLDIVTMAERRLVRRLTWTALSILVPVLFLAGAVIWGSVAAYLSLTEFTTPRNAALLLLGASVGIALLSMLGFRLGRVVRRRDHALENAVADLISREVRDGDLRADVAALILLVSGLGARRR